MKLIYGLLLLIHGIIHFMGLAKAYHLGNMAQFSKDISKPMGLLWLLSGLLFIAVTILYFLKKETWPMLAMVAVVVSQLLIFMVWKDAKYGTIANIVILIIAIVGYGTERFENSYKLDVVSAMGTAPFIDEPVTEKDLGHLPFPVQKHLRYVGVLGRPKVQNFKINFKGEMRDKGKDWFKFISEQYNFLKFPTRLFFMKAKVKGLPTAGYHAYQGQNAGMLIKLLSLFPVARFDGQELYATETVTFFNDLCLFAPAALIDDRIVWEAIDNTSAKAAFTSNGTTISAILFFNEKGQLVNFISEDRISVSEMKTFPFSTPVKDYQKINGFNLPTYGKAIWHYPDGEFVYGKFKLKSLEYNLTEFK